MTNYCETSSVMDDTKQFPIIQVEFLEKIGDAAVANQYGVHTSPDKESPALLIYINNDPTNRIIIPLSTFNRNKDLEESEVEVGNFTKTSSVKFDKDGNIDIVCNGIVNVTAPTINLGQSDFERIVKGTKLSEWISNEINAVFAAHVHPVTVPSTPFAGNTSTPSNSMSDPSVSDLSSDAHSVGD